MNRKGNDEGARKLPQGKEMVNHAIKSQVEPLFGSGKYRRSLLLLRNPDKQVVRATLGIGKFIYLQDGYSKEHCRHLVWSQCVAGRGETFLKKGSPHAPSKEF